MAREASARFEEFFAMRGIARRLMFERRARQTLLPNECSDGRNFIVRRKSELRHFCRGTEFVRVAEPVRNPLFPELHPSFFQIRPDLFYFLQKRVAATLVLNDLRVNAANGNREIRSLGVERVCGLIVR